jgi:hypothetical protein
MSSPRCDSNNHWNYARVASSLPTPCLTFSWDMLACAFVRHSTVNSRMMMMSLQLWNKSEIYGLIYDTLNHQNKAKNYLSVFYISLALQISLNTHCQTRSRVWCHIQWWECEGWEFFAPQSLSSRGYPIRETEHLEHLSLEVESEISLWCIRALYSKFSKKNIFKKFDPTKLIQFKIRSKYIATLTYIQPYK